MNKLWLSILPAFALGACGHDAGTMMSDFGQDSGRHMEALQAEECSTRRRRARFRRSTQCKAPNRRTGSESRFTSIG